MSTTPPEVPAQPWANHIIKGLKNPKFFERKVKDLSVDELLAIESQWLPKVRQAWDQVIASQQADARAFEAAIAYHGIVRTKPDPEIIRAKDDIPDDIRARLKQICPFTGPGVPQSVQERKGDLLGIWLWHDEMDDDDDDTPGQWEIALCDMNDDESGDTAGTAVIRPSDNKYDEYTLFFIGLEWAGVFDFDDLLSAKRCLDELLFTATPRIPTTRAN